MYTGSGQVRLGIVSLLVALSVLAGTGCQKRTPLLTASPPPLQDQTRQDGYAIQVGAFSNVENAVRLTKHLINLGYEAFYFIDRSGLFKVRLGDFRTEQEAVQTGDRLRQSRVIEAFFVVYPTRPYPAWTLDRKPNRLRHDLVNTARWYIGYPYAWGGATPDRGFDCSGLTMAVYKLNGLTLPRSSWAQFIAGKPIRRSHLKAGDLVFFDTRNDNRDNVSHVGIYTGNNMFIHAPGRNKVIRFDSLDSRFYRTRFVGARTYM